MKKYLLLGLVLLGTLFANAGKAEAASTLRQCYQEKGLAWTSVSQRAIKAAELGIFYYKGTAAQNTQFKNLLCTDKLGFSVATGYQRALRVGASASQDYFQVTSLALRDGTILDITALGGKVFLNVEPGSAKEEIVMCTGINTSTIRFTDCTRGLAFSGTSTASVAANAKTHNASSIIVMSNVHYVYEQYVDVNSKNQTVAGDKTYTGSSIFASTTFGVLPISITTTPSLPGNLITLDYLTTVTTTGCANASTAVRGCVEKATNAEVEAGTATGATGAQTFVGADTWLEYSDTHWSNNLPVGENVTAYNVLYITASGTYKIAHANVQAEVDKVAGVTLETVTATNYPRVYKSGSVIYGISGMTTGSLVYLADDGTASTTAGTIRKVLGIALGTNVWDFNPTVDTPNPTPAAGVIPLASASGTLDIWLSMIRGNGSDGTVTISASTTLTRDMFYNNLTINSGVVVSSSYKIHVLGTLTNAGTIQRNGFNGSAGTSGTTGLDAACDIGLGGAGAAGVPSGSLGGSAAGQAGGNGSDGGGTNNAPAGTAGTAVVNTISGSGATSGAGGQGTGGSAGAAGSAGAVGAATSAANSPTSTFSAVAQYDFGGIFMGWSGSGGGGGGSGGYNGSGGAQNGCGGGGGGSASSGGTIWISANSIVNSGTISSNGGTGGNGGSGGDTTTDGGKGGGGAGGNGGNIFLFYHILTNTGSITVTGGNGGALGASGNGGAAGTNGSSGKVWHFQF